MGKDILEKIKNESEALYAEVLRVAGKKWDIISFEKESAELYNIRAGKIKKPDVVMKVKCVHHNSKWFLVGEK